MTPANFETAISAGDRPQTYATDRTATGTGCTTFFYIFFNPSVACVLPFGGKKKKMYMKEFVK
jgi:hypothetical protein